MQAGSRPPWLAQAAATGICPLCLAVDEFEADYLRRFCGELDDPSRTISEFVRARGFCFHHTEKLERELHVSQRSVGEALGLYLPVLDALVADLAQLEQDAWLQTAECPLCLSRDQHLVGCAHRLMDELTGKDETAQTSRPRGDLCIGHFVMTWVVSAEDADRDSLRDLQLGETARLAQRVRSLLRVVSTVDEGDPRRVVAIWRRAARVVSGWTVASR